MQTLASAVLILSSSDPDTPGDLSLFRDIATAERGLEAIDVRNNEYFGFALDGRPLQFTAEGDLVRIEVASSSQSDEARVRSLLERYARFCFKGKAMFEDFSRYSLAQLVEVIGFSR